MKKTKINWSDKRVRVRKRGKTRGRPSKVEILLTHVVDKEMSRPEVSKTLKDAIRDALLYGQSWVEIPWPTGKEK